MIDILKYIFLDSYNLMHQKESCSLMKSLCSFDFTFILYLIFDILGIIDELSKALQREDPNIINAIELVNVSKQRL